MPYDIQQSTTQAPLVFLLVDNVDHITGKAGLTPAVTISKAGAAFASAAGATAEIGSGWYKVAANATDCNTFGPILLHATGTSADPCDIIVANIVAYNPQDATRLGLTALPNANAEAAGGLYTRGAGAGQIKQTNNGEIDSNITHVNNVATTAVTTIKAVLGLTTADTIVTVSGNVNGPVASVTAGVTVSTNNDKTGYALTAAYDPAKTASQAGDSMALTSSERNSTADALLARSLGTEGYAAKGATPTVAQTMFMLLQNMQEISIASTTLTVKKLDGSTGAMTFTLDSATAPTSRTRAT